MFNTPPIKEKKTIEPETTNKNQENSNSGNKSGHDKAETSHPKPSVSNTIPIGIFTNPRKTRLNSTEDTSFYQLKGTKSEKVENTIKRASKFDNKRRISLDKQRDINKQFANEDSQTEYESVDEDEGFESKLQQTFTQETLNIPVPAIFKHIPTGTTTPTNEETSSQILEGIQNIFKLPKNSQKTLNHPDDQEIRNNHRMAVTLRDLIGFKIPFFDGNEKELNGFINTCEMYFTLTPDELHETLLRLIKAKITGEALNKIQPIENHETWNNLKLSLKNAIQKPVSYEFANEELNNIFQKRDETIELFGKRVRECLQKLNEAARNISNEIADLTAYRKTHEKLAISKFVQNIRNPELRTLVAAANKFTLEENIVFAMEKELLEKNSNIRGCSVCNSNQHRDINCPQRGNSLSPRVSFNPNPNFNRYSNFNQSRTNFRRSAPNFGNNNYNRNFNFPNNQNRDNFNREMSNPNNRFNRDSNFRPSNINNSPIRPNEGRPNPTIGPNNNNNNNGNNRNNSNNGNNGNSNFNRNNNGNNNHYPNNNRNTRVINEDKSNSEEDLANLLENSSFDTVDEKNF